MLQEELIKHGIDWVNNFYPYKNPVPYNTNKLERMLIKHIKKGSIIAIFPDSDVDGFLSAVIVKSLCELLGCKNIKVLVITEKTHGLNNRFIDQTLLSEAELLITVDSSTNNENAVNKLSQFDVDHIIIDHHEISVDVDDYPSNVVVVNSKDVRNEGFNNVSAGMLCYIIVHNLLNKVQISKSQRDSFLNKMYILGYITLYTDCMDLKDVYNLSVIQNIDSKREFTPKVVTQFMSKYDMLCRNFIEYKFGPRINALIRRERFDLVYEILFNRHTEAEKSELMMLIEEVYDDSRNIMKLLADNLYVDVNRTYVIGNLDTVQFRKDYSSIIKNYTGLVANNLASKYQKLAIVVSTDKVDTYKGSVRDPYSRKSLKLFERFCDCGGHMSAFGFRLMKRDYENFNNQLDMLSGMLSASKQVSQIVMNGSDFSDNIIYKMRNIADYNEISGNTLPKAVIVKRIGHNQKIRKEDKYIAIMWEGMKIICFGDVRIGDTIIITPTLSKDDVTLFGNLKTE